MPASYLKIGGNLSDNAVLESVEVTQALNDHWRCHVECRQTGDVRIAVEDSLGKDLQIVTRDQQGAQHIVFDGIVLEATIVYEIWGTYTARFAGITRSHKLDLTEQEAYFRKKTLGDVASALAGADGLSAGVKCQSKRAKNYVQWGESDFQFLKRIAYEHKAWMRPTAGGIEICDTFQGGSQLAWRQEGGLVEFDVEGALSQPSFNGTHHDARNMKSTSFAKTKVDATFSGASGPMVSAVTSVSQAMLPPGYLHLDSRAATAAEYQDALGRESIRSIGGALSAHGVSQNDTLKAGDAVDISGPFDAKGNYGITKVIHRWTRLGYKNEFWCTPWNNYFSPEGLTHRTMPGVVVARVVDHNDPRKMGRIKIQYDWQGESETGWARMTTPHSGAGRGLMFMPEKGDEVLVGFEHGDAERPYILGALWNGVDTAPRDVFWGGDIEPNDIKRIVTKSGHRIQLSDKEGKESIVMSTPRHLKISLLEKADETGRSMILLHSDNGDLFFNAPDGRVHLRSRYLSQEINSGGATSAVPTPQSNATPPPRAASPAPEASVHPSSSAGIPSRAPKPSIQLASASLIPAAAVTPGAPKMPNRAQGSPQYALTQAQDTARSKLENQPHDGKTFCNIATHQIVSALGGSLQPFTTRLPKGKTRPATANEISANLPKSKDYREVTADEAQQLADHGQLVVAVQPHKGHGHVATLRPDNLEGEAAPTKGSGPVINQIGRNVDIMRQSKAFYRSPAPKYFAPVQQGSDGTVQ
jgi:uncharacterized protein involved in type VI secretion and phage assembly